MDPIELYFDGYCPESMLKGKQVDMRLNEDDFWESEATGLQIVVSPPFAVILLWRGKGRFKDSSPLASDTLTGLIMTQAIDEEGMELLPNMDEIINHKNNLQWYLYDIYESKEKLDATIFNPNDPALDKQAQYLTTLSSKDFEPLIKYYDALKADGYTDLNTDNPHFSALHKNLYDLKLVFDFPWMNWKNGKRNISNQNFDYTNASLLELSMYFTTIFRADRFNDGTIEGCFRNVCLDKIFERLRSVLAD
jgi:hypothetical protein